MEMQVKYRTTLDDYVAFCRYHYRHSRTALVNWLVGWLLLPVGGLLYLAYRISQHGWNSTLLGWVGAALAYLAVYPFVHRFFTDISVRGLVSERGSRGMIGDIELIITEQALVEVTETTRSEVAWGNIHRLEDQGDYMFIYVNPLAAAIVPRHGFKSDQEYERVKEFAKECFSRGRADVAKPN